MKATPEQQKFLDRMTDHVVAAAEIAEVAYEKDLIRNILDAYCDFFCGSAVTFVTNTKPGDKRTLSVRYVDFDHPHDPYAIARAEGFLVPDGHPVDTILDEIRGRFPLLGYGVDLEVSRGLTKIWVFLRTPRPVEESFALPSLPDSIRDHQEYFSRHQLQYMSLFALDYHHLSTNIYFMVPEPGKYTIGKIEKMIGELGLEVPDRQLLDYCKYAATIYPTFNWQSPHAERLCLGMAAGGVENVPTHLHPLLEKYTREVPIVSPDRMFIYSVTPGRRDHYIKIENDYTGTMIKMMIEGTHAVPT